MRNALVAAAFALLVAPAGDAAAAPGFALGSVTGAPSPRAADRGPIGDLGDALCRPLRDAERDLAGVPPASSAAGALAELACQAHLLEFSFQTVYDPPGGGDAVRREHDAVLNVPVPLDVDGVPGAELVGQLQLIDTSHAALRIERALGAPSALPVSVEAVLQDPRGESREVAFGYDTRDSTAPDIFDATLSLQGGGRATTLGVDVRTIGAGERLAVTGALYTAGQSGERDDPQFARIAYSPVPTQTSILLATGESNQATLTATSPTRVDIAAGAVDGAERQDLAATIDSLPSSMTLSFESAGGVERARYAATGQVDRIAIDLAERDGPTVTSRSEIAIDDVPLSMELESRGSGQATLDASGPIGVLDAAIASGGDARRLGEPAYVRSVEQGSLRSIALRVLGLEHATTAASGGLHVDAKLRSGPFRLLLEHGQRTIDASARDLPSEVELDVDAGAGTLDYTGSAAMDALTVDASDPAGIAGRAPSLELALAGVPAALSVGFSDDGQAVVLDAHESELDSLAVTATTGPRPSFEPGADGVVLHDSAADYLLAGRISGLRRVSITQKPTPDLQIDSTARRVFTADVRQPGSGGELALDARIDRLAPQTRVRLLDDAQGKRVIYSAQDPTGEIRLEGSNIPGLSGRAKDVSILLRQVPVTLSLGLAKASGEIDIDAGASTLGLLEAQLTSGPDDRIAAGRDGILLNDLASKYVLFARVTGLRSAKAIQAPAPDLTIDATGNQIFAVDLNEQEGSKVTYTRATLDRLKPGTRVRIVPTAAGQQVLYTASASTNRLDFETNAGDRQRLTASVASPLPASLTLCQATDRSCGGSGRTANAGSVTLTASEHTTVNLFDCVRPLTGSCTPSSSTDSINVSNLRVRKLVEDANASSTGSSGHIYLDTDDHALSGDIAVKKPGNLGGITAHFPSGFRAQNRLRRWSFFVVVETQGSVTCPSGTSLSVRVFGINIGVTGYLCGF